MRIIGGTYKGRKISTPGGPDIRPTTDRIRESLFNILEHGFKDFAVRDCRVIDLFAGTGALGIEALSRDARFALFIEENADARGLIRQNIEDFGLGGKSKIFRRDATHLSNIGTMEVFSLAFLDPPYGLGLGEKALKALHKGEWLSPNAVIVLEEEKKSQITLPEQFEKLEKRIYGNTQIIIARYKD